MNGHLSVAKYLVNQKADISAKNMDGNTPLHEAARSGRLNVVEYLVNQKIDINECCCGLFSSRTPLHYASEKGYLNVVQYLVNQKADINKKDKNVES